LPRHEEASEKEREEIGSQGRGEEARGEESSAAGQGERKTGVTARQQWRLHADPDRGDRLEAVPLPAAVALARFGRARAALVSAGVALALLSSCALHRDGDWRSARRDSSGQAPDPLVTSEPVVQVYVARTVGWKSAFAVHSWITYKRRGASVYSRYEVIGWGVQHGTAAIRFDRAGPDDYWFGARPDRLVDLRGNGVDAVIDRIEGAIARYPYASSYRTWPGPNSNTFTAWVGREVPELRLDLPPTAIGKDFLPNGALVARSPSGLGVQLSVLGVAGLLAGWEEGLEVQLLGLTVGVDVKEPALKLPLLGRLGHSGAH
jgi:hypothetical protein